MILLATIAAAAAMADPAIARINARAEACITANAADVERAEPNLSSAVDFLLNDLCALPVAVNQRYRQSVELLGVYRGSPQMFAPDEDADPKLAAKLNATAKKQMDAYAHATISEETGEIILPAGTQNLAMLTVMAQTQPTPELRAFAAKALLDARHARQTR
jgi:hypothetical protein